MLKDMNRSGRILKGDNYEGYDDFNNSTENGLYVYLKFNDEQYEICSYVNNIHVLESIALINEKAKEEGDSFGEYIYLNNFRKDDYYMLINKVIKVLSYEKYISQ